CRAVRPCSCVSPRYRLQGRTVRSLRLFSVFCCPCPSWLMSLAFCLLWLASRGGNVHHMDLPGGRIAYELPGESCQDTLVVCVPVIFDHRASYLFIGTALAEAGHRVAAMDLRGHGDSDTTFETYTDRDAATDVIALSEELGGENVVVVGNSLGAAAAALAAIDRPDLVAGVALLGPFLRPPVTSVFQRLALRVLLLRPW